MPFVYPNSGQVRAGMGRPLVMGLFVASCLLSIVSFYTTQQGMALYLSPWFATLAALGVQVSLVLVAWLVGFQRSGRTLLTVVYVITAIVSIAFSYVSLYNWFAARERPAVVQRGLYDELNGIAASAGQRLNETTSKARHYVVALEEMTEAEKRHGHISQAPDADPALQAIRESVAREAQAIGAAYREGSGEGARYTAFERHTKLMKQSLAELQGGERALAAWRAEARPDHSSEQQIRRFNAMYNSLPWATMDQLAVTPTPRPVPPSLARYVDRAGSSQEDLMYAFQELFSAPTSRHLFSLALAAFIDVIVFLLAFASGPYFYGATEERMCAAGAALDATEEQVFVRDLLRKMRPSGQGLARVEASALTPGEQQYCLAMAQRGQAVVEDSADGPAYLLDREVHERLMESLAQRGLPLRAASRSAAAG
ncbi:MAG: hypothetical protein IPJ98_19000 [Bryobacterales bacterium]|nr:hypothetical protein [Bryobacterales bacterium]